MVAALDLNKLAIEGGAPVRTTAWPAWPTFPADEVAACTDVLVSGKVNYWTGSVGRAFEREFAEFVGVPHAIACSNGTVARGGEAKVGVKTEERVRRGAKRWSLAAGIVRIGAKSGGH